MYVGRKIMTIYQVRGRVLGFMAVIGVVAFILFLAQFYNTDPHSSVNFGLPSVIKGGLKFEGTTGPTFVADPKSRQQKDEIYAIVFDAGSTGSRVHIFHFETIPGSPIKLVNEVFEQVKPGLSSYADDPMAAAQSLNGMLKLCKEKVPETKHATTPLMLKATAGLRLLPGKKAEIILNEVFALLKKYPFRLLNGSVGIMDGTDEGVFSWLTVNFMLGKLKPGADPVPALDLGGGSTQITFVPKTKESIESVPKNFLKEVNLFKSSYQLYTHSYLGLGLMSARLTLIGGDDKNALDPSTFFLNSSCIRPNYTGTYEHGGKEYQLKGSTPDRFQYVLCEGSAKTLVLSQKVKPVKELSDKPVFAFSYFFDRALESKLIGSEGGVVKVVDFKNAATKEFSSPSVDYPFLGLDLTYMYAMLNYGYHLSDSTPIHLEKKIDGVEVSWGLGSAFNLMSAAGLAR